MVAAALQLLVGGSRHHPLAAADKLAVVCGDHGAQENDAQRDEIYLMTDSLMVRSMVGGSGHGAGASYAGYTDLMDSHDDVFAY